MSRTNAGFYSRKNLACCKMLKKIKDRKKNITCACARDQRIKHVFMCVRKREQERERESKRAKLSKGRREIERETQRLEKTRLFESNHFWKKNKCAPASPIRKMLPITAKRNGRERGESSERKRQGRQRERKLSKNEHTPNYKNEITPNPLILNKELTPTLTTRGVYLYTYIYIYV